VFLLVTLVDIKAKLYDVSYHDVTQMKQPFKVAASMALKKLLKKQAQIILEPIDGC